MIRFNFGKIPESEIFAYPNDDAGFRLLGISGAAPLYANAKAEIGDKFALIVFLKVYPARRDLRDFRARLA